MEIRFYTYLIKSKSLIIAETAINRESSEQNNFNFSNAIRDRRAATKLGNNPWFLATIWKIHKHILSRVVCTHKIKLHFVSRQKITIKLSNIDFSRLLIKILSSSYFSRFIMICRLSIQRPIFPASSFANQFSAGLNFTRLNFVSVKYLQEKSNVDQIFL